MRVKTWKLLDNVSGDLGPQTVPLTCHCGTEAEIPVSGRASAVVSGMGVVFDSGDYVLPPRIQCRRCGRVYQLESGHVR